MRYLCLFALFATSCTVLTESRDWTFVQSVGGIAIGAPTKEFAGWVLPVRADVSGRTITVEPVIVNSALVCTAVKAAIEGNAIFVTVKTGLARKGHNAACPSANLGHIKPGQYTVFYREPGGKTVRLREVTIGQ